MHLDNAEHAAAQLLLMQQIVSAVANTLTNICAYSLDSSICSSI